MRSLRRVLIADDNRVFRAALREVFETMHVDVVESPDGRDAYAKIESQDFDLLIVDLLMPQMDGFEVMRKLRAEHTDLRPVVFLTTAVYKSRRWEDEGRRTFGADEFLPKPIDVATLTAAIGRHFALP
jgi:CheY-like chemotaxis protein